MDETYLKVQGRWVYLYRAIDGSGALVDVMLSETRDMAAAKAFFRSTKTVTGISPAGSQRTGTTATHGRSAPSWAGTSDTGPAPISTTGLNRIIVASKGRYRPMRGFKSVRSAARFCRGYDELRNFLQPRRPHHQPVSANHRRLHVLCAATTAISILQAA